MSSTDSIHFFVVVDLYIVSYTPNPWGVSEAPGHLVLKCHLFLLWVHEHELGIQLCRG